MKADKAFVLQRNTALLAKGVLVILSCTEIPLSSLNSFLVGFFLYETNLSCNFQI
jgi:hypothetical protein